MNHQLQQLTRFCLETEGLRLHLGFGHLRSYLQFCL